MVSANNTTPKLKHDSNPFVVHGEIKAPALLLTNKPVVVLHTNDKA